MAYITCHRCGIIMQPIESPTDSIIKIPTDRPLTPMEKQLHLVFVGRKIEEITCLGFWECVRCGKVEIYRNKDKEQELIKDHQKTKEQFNVENPIKN